MDSAPQHEVTLLLHRWKGGEQAALDALMPIMESELRRLASGYMRNERPGHTLQPTALINEAWLRMVKQSQQPDYEGHSHFVAVAAQYMRQILVEYARRRNAQKRGAGQRAELDEATIFMPERSGDLAALDDGLNELAQFDPRQAKIVELRFFGGLGNEEIADFLGIGRSTVIRDLRMAQVWLKNYLTT